MGPWGQRGDDTLITLRGQRADKPAAPLTEAQISCQQCSAVLAYLPGSSSLQCQYCGSEQTVDVQPIEIVEHDLSLALADEATGADLEEVVEATCASCAASFTFDADLHAGDCPFCGHGIVKDTGGRKRIKPAAIIPFAIAEADARAQVRQWLKGLWFAPNKLRRMGQPSGSLHGIYLPYWTFDSATSTAYTGQRGDIYMEPQRVSVVVNGKRQTQTRMVQKVRWRPARGRVSRRFDDVLISASHSLPDWMEERLGPWKLGDLKPYTPLFVVGFQSESYNVLIA